MGILNDELNRIHRGMAKIADKYFGEGEKMPRLKLIEMDSLNKMIYFRKDDKLIAFDADVAIELISDSLDGKYAPVRHGRWINCSETFSDGDFECSVCQKRVWDNTDYCPNCGAKMDGERREDGKVL